MTDSVLIDSSEASSVSTWVFSSSFMTSAIFIEPTEFFSASISRIISTTRGLDDLRGLGG